MTAGDGPCHAAALPHSQGARDLGSPNVKQMTAAAPTKFSRSRVPHFDSQAPSGARHVARSTALRFLVYGADGLSFICVSAMPALRRYGIRLLLPPLLLGYFLPP